MARGETVPWCPWDSLEQAVRQAHHRRTLGRSAPPVSPQAALLRLAGDGGHVFC